MSKDITTVNRRSTAGLSRYQPPAFPAPAPHAPNQLTVWDLWLILRKRKWAILSTMLVVLTISIIQTARTIPLYDASARLAFYREDGDLLGLKDASAGNSEDFDYTVSLDTQARVIQSDVVAMQVIKAMNLQSNPAFAGSIAKNHRAGEPLSTDDETSLLEKFSGSLRVVPIRNTRILELHFMSPDPKLSSEIVNTLMRTYIEHNFRTKLDATLQATDWMAKQITELQLKVEASQQALVKYQREHQILGTDEKQNIITTKLDQLNRELTAAQADRMQKEARYQQTLTGNLSAIPELSQNGLINNLQEQAAALEREHAEAQVKFGSSYPKVVELGQKLEQAKLNVRREIEAVSSRVKSEYLTSLDRERLLTRAFETQKQEANQLNESSIQYEILKRDAEMNRTLYENLQQKQKEATLTAGLKSNNVRPVDTARIPTYPSTPNIPRNIILALMLGTSAGIALAFVLEGLDNRVRTTDHIEDISGMPALATIPLQQDTRIRGSLKSGSRPSNSKQMVIAAARPRSEIAEAYRALRTSILLAISDAPPKSIVVTSSLPREGKTTTSVNLAVVLAQKGARVLLVDADLRRPSVHTVLGLHSSVGLSTLLTASSTAGDVMQQTPQVHGLYVIPAGPPPHHPSELLGSDRMQELITKWEQEFDHVILDTPPVLSVTDAVSLSASVHGVLMVVRSGSTRKDAFRRMQTLLEQVNARILGVVLNALDLTAADSHHYYYYGASQTRYYDQ